MKQHCLMALCVISCILGGCVATPAESSSPTGSATTSTAESTSAQAGSAPTLSAESAVSTESETQSSQTTSTTDDALPEISNADLQLIGAPEYDCQIEVPQDWVASEGASDGVVTSDMCVFQPQLPNGDSISLVVADSETPAFFETLTESDFMEVYEQSFTAVTAVEMESLTVSGCPAYRVNVTGELEIDMPIEVTQLLINREDNHLYSFTYTNVSGNAPVYLENIETYFHFI